MATNGKVSRLDDEMETQVKGKLEAGKEGAAGLVGPVALVSSPFFTYDEAAAYARCSKRTIQRWVDAKKISTHGHGRPLILKAQLHAFLLAGKGDEA